MLKKILDVLTNNAGTKVLAFFLAIFAWMIVLSVTNPQTTTTYTATVVIKNDAILTEHGKVYEVVDGFETVKFTVSGPRDVIENLSVTDFQVVADMNKINVDMETVPIDVIALKDANKVEITVHNPNMLITLDNVKTAQFVITTNVHGQPTSGYVLGTVEAVPRMITITGPETVIDRIQTVVADLPVDGWTPSNTIAPTPVQLTLYDANGSVVSASRLTLDHSYVDIDVQLLETKEVVIDFEEITQIRTGYSLTSIESNPKTVVVKGTREQLSSFSVITIPADELALTDETGEITRNISITQYLPEGVTLVDETQGTVSVAAVIEKYETDSFYVPVNDIEVLNLNPMFGLSFSAETVRIHVKGPVDLMDSLSNGSFKLYIDLSQYNKEGTYNVSVTRNEIEGLTDLEPITVSITLELLEIEEEVESEEE